jgi:hypothetical protein
MASMMWRLRGAVLCVAVLPGVSCGGNSPTGPTPPAVRVTAIAPASGSTFGGTAVTISGDGFAAGATVTIGGVAATAVVVVGDRSITAATPARTAGAADVVVSVAGRQGSLPAAFTFVAPNVGPNAPPAVQPLQAQGARPGQPPAMADLGEAIAISTTVTDTESDVAALTLAWTATVGTIEGDGASVTFRAPATLAQTPATASITLTVIERYVEAGQGGLPVEREHRVERTIQVRVHDSAKEIAALTRQFLLLFSDSSNPPATVVAEFSDTCAGKETEFQDVVDNRNEYLILSSVIGDASVTVNFNGICDHRGRQGDACAYSPVQWTSRNLATGGLETVSGISEVAAVYVSQRWWLCDSQFIPDGPSATSRFLRGR